MNVNNLGNQNVNYWIENFGKSSLFCLRKEVNFDYITNQKCDLTHVSFDKHTWKTTKSKTESEIERRLYVSLNTESCVDFNPLVKRVYQEHFCLLSNEWKDCDLLVKLVVLMLNLPSNQVIQSMLIDR